MDQDAAVANYGLPGCGSQPCEAFFVPKFSLTNPNH
jgi:hypothetical protein